MPVVAYCARALALLIMLGVLVWVMVRASPRASTTAGHATPQPAGGALAPPRAPAHDPAPPRPPRAQGHLGGLALAPTAASGQGGGNDTGKLFNWHPLLMTLAFCVFMAEALLTYVAPLVPMISRWVGGQRGRVRQHGHSMAARSTTGTRRRPKGSCAGAGVSAASPCTRSSHAPVPTRACTMRVQG